MNDRINYTASKLSDQELKERIENRPKYLPETIEASIAELHNRGVEFSDEELQVINEDLVAQRENASLSNNGNGFKSTYKNNIVEDLDAPFFYSRRALFFFSFGFGALFGSIMLAINLSKIKNRKGMFWILLFGVGFTILQAILMNYANPGSSPGALFGILSGFCIDYIFWPLLIGKSTMYRARPIWTPLIIGIVLGALVVWSIISGGER
jgi:hypothetical protein